MSKVLIIDDEKAIRYSLREILEYEKYEVDEAKDGEEGLEKIKQNEYDIALCDIKMPKMDGMEVLEKAMELGKEVQFIMISAHGNIETAVEATKKGAFDFIQKPPDLNRLLITMRNALDKFGSGNEGFAQKSFTHIRYRWRVFGDKAGKRNDRKGSTYGGSCDDYGTKRLWKRVGRKMASCQK